jgi:carbonic anhydrase
VSSDAVVVVEHTSCGGIEAAWVMAQDSPTESAIPPGTPLQRWLTSLVILAKELGLKNPPFSEEKTRALRILSEEKARRQVLPSFFPVLPSF